MAGWTVVSAPVIAGALERPDQRDLQHLVHARPGRRRAGVENVLGDLRQILLVVLGQTMFFMPARCAASTFSLTPPIGSTWPRSVISPVIATSFRTGDPAERRDQRGGHGDARRRAVLRDGALGDVDVDVDRLGGSFGIDARAARRDRT